LTDTARPRSTWRERLGWLAVIALAVLVVCSGCFMFFAFALTARGELEASVLGSDWRVWQLPQKGTSGVGVSQAFARASPSGRQCRETRIWLITWRPRLNIESIADVADCETRLPLRRLLMRDLRI
jgi:hypothetical protein